MIPEIAGLFDPSDNMEGVLPRLPVVKIVSQAEMFKMADESLVAEIEGIVLDSNRCNAWWETSFDASGGGDYPDCASLDNLVPTHGDNIQAKTCAACPHNKFGTGVDRNGTPTRGKACSNRRRVHLVMAGEPLPVRLSLSPAMLPAWGVYMTTLTKLGIAYPSVVTTIKLERTQSRSGHWFSMPVFSCEVRDGKGVLAGDRAVMQQIVDFRDLYREVMRGQEIELSEMGDSDETGEPEATGDKPPY